MAPSYVDGCLAEYSWAREHPDHPDGLWPEPLPATLYLGGGTPSQLAPCDLARLVAGIELADGAEVTVEANPDDVTPAWAGAARSAGVTRVSLGVQSFAPEVLASLGRLHGPELVAPAVGALSRAGIAQVSVDLIYGATGETDESWAATLAAVLELDPAPRHVSAYGLTAEPGTVLWADRTRHPDDDIEARRYETADDVLGEAGYSWYEISNFALAGSRCRHNQNYWTDGDYRGLGCAAHSHRQGRRWWNRRTPERYLAAVAAGTSATAASETLDSDARALETLELSLRTPAGVPEVALEDCSHLEDLGLVEVRCGRAVLTLRGRLLANEVACRLRAAGGDDLPL